MASLARGSRVLLGVTAFCVLLFPAWGRSTALGSTLGQGSAAHKSGARSPILDRIRKDGVIREGVVVALPAVGENPKNNQYFGVGIDLGRILAKGLHVKVQLVPSSWDTIIAAVQAGKIDIAVAGLFATPARLKVVNMTTYFKEGFCFFVMKSNHKLHKVSDLNSPSVTFGNFQGTGNYQTVSKAFPKAKERIRVANPGEVQDILDLITGRVDVVSIDSVVTPYYLQKYPQTRVIPPNCGPLNPQLPTPVGVAYAKGDSVFKKYVQDTVKANGRYLQADVIKYSAPKYSQ